MCQVLEVIFRAPDWTRMVHGMSDWFFPAGHMTIRPREAARAAEMYRGGVRTAMLVALHGTPAGSMVTVVLLLLPATLSLPISPFSTVNIIPLYFQVVCHQRV